MIRKSEKIRFGNFQYDSTSPDSIFECLSNIPEIEITDFQKGYTCEYYKPAIIYSNDCKESFLKNLGHERRHHSPYDTSEGSLININIKRVPFTGKLLQFIGLNQKTETPQNPELKRVSDLTDFVQGIIKKELDSSPFKKNRYSVKTSDSVLGIYEEKPAFLQYLFLLGTLKDNIDLNLLNTNDAHAKNWLFNLPNPDRDSFIAHIVHPTTIMIMR